MADQASHLIGKYAYSAYAHLCKKQSEQLPLVPAACPGFVGFVPFMQKATTYIGDLIAQISHVLVSLPVGWHLCLCLVRNPEREPLPNSLLVLIYRQRYIRRRFAMRYPLRSFSGTAFISFLPATANKKASTRGGMDAYALFSLWVPTTHFPNPGYLKAHLL